ncbi:glycosyltransferase family 2 protein [Paenibacillus sp. GSMTC-2017]|uniref:glycosyltransferase family 2 protein n=1 Tax=Paenibacillus sp. GSMTC-2017 TaxID=2794350 RepID=UPI0018D7AD9F|nr:glycosyltransferase family A protein [Paenibacillus sp. GSMTC-2017]MBH5317306.1 glycosyltransferase family 2 protein [Paenibacillus sp. GSMTC-2017]
MKTVTVFTPTYNRAYCLGRLYESMKRQTCDDFEWLIIDDGSTDNTESLVQVWQLEDAVSIRYVKQENQGMHGAHNTAYEQITTELNVCIDSDDYLSDRAIEMITSFWDKNGSNEVSGFVALDAYSDDTIIGTKLPTELSRSNLFDLYNKHGVRGDKKLVYRSILTTQFPYPIFPDERYVGLAYKYYKLDEQYPLLLLNEVLCIVEYMEDGSSRNMLKQYVRNPKGFTFYRKALMESPLCGLSYKFRQAIHYVSSSILSRNKQWLKDSPMKWMTLLAVPPGVLLYCFIAFKTRKEETLWG